MSLVGCYGNDAKRWRKFDNMCGQTVAQMYDDDPDVAQYQGANWAECSLQTLAARAYAPVMTPSGVGRLSEELCNFLQAHSPWYCQLGVFATVRGFVRAGLSSAGSQIEPALEGRLSMSEHINIRDLVCVRETEAMQIETLYGRRWVKHGWDREWYHPSECPEYAPGCQLPRKREAYYENGKRHGPSRKWLADDRLRQIRNYSEGRLHGITRKWFHRENYLHEYNYHHNEQHGYTLSYSLAEGVLYEESPYVHDVEHGVERSWDAQGYLNGIIVYDRGTYMLEISRDSTPYINAALTHEGVDYEANCRLAVPRTAPRIGQAVFDESTSTWMPENMSFNERFLYRLMYHLDNGDFDIVKPGEKNYLAPGSRPLISDNWMHWLFAAPPDKSEGLRDHTANLNAAIQKLEKKAARLRDRLAKAQAHWTQLAGQ